MKNPYISRLFEKPIHVSNWENAYPGFSPWLTATPLTWQICYRIPSMLSPLRFWKNGEIAMEIHQKLWGNHGESSSFII